MNLLLFACASIFPTVLADEINQTVNSNISGIVEPEVYITDGHGAANKQFPFQVII